jgi:hypothetical protein
MSEPESTEIISLRLDHMEDLLNFLHDEFVKTNGRVTILEMEETRWHAKEESSNMHRMIFTTVMSGAILAGIVWFVTQAI